MVALQRSDGSGGDVEYGSRYTSLDRIRAGLGGSSHEIGVIPIDCTDGFNEAYYARPEQLLDPGAN